MLIDALVGAVSTTVLLVDDLPKNLIAQGAVLEPLEADGTTLLATACSQTLRSGRFSTSVGRAPRFSRQP